MSATARGVTRGPVPENPQAPTQSERGVAQHWAANVLPPRAVDLAVDVAQRFNGTEAELSGAGTGTRPVGFGGAARKALGLALQEYRTRTQQQRA